MKSPNDRLSETQQVWLAVLGRVGADAAVCKVVHSGGAKPDPGPE